MGRSPDLPDEARRILSLAVSDRRAASEALRNLSPEEQAVIVCETPLSRRAEILELTPHPEEVVPELPEAELCFMARAVGLSDAGWFLAHATAEQIVTCVDLDAWSSGLPDASALSEWINAFVDGGAESTYRAARELDPELLVLLLQDRMEVALKPNEEGWIPPRGSITLDGQFYFRARRPDDDLADLQRLLQVLFERDYWLYFRLLQGANWELRSETEEWTLHWRTGRLEDLGFPPRERAMVIYSRLSHDQRAVIPEKPHVLDVNAWHLPAATSRLPATADQGQPLFAAVDELDEGERSAFFQAFVSLANQVAVADELPLGDAESLPAAIEKASRIAGRGLEFLAHENGLGHPDVLRRVPVAHLFRVGASLESEGVEE